MWFQHPRSVGTSFANLLNSSEIRSNKHGYNVAYDAPFARFQKFFQEAKFDGIFSPEHILPGDLVAFLQRVPQRRFSLHFHGLPGGNRWGHRPGRQR